MDPEMEAAAEDFRAHVELLAADLGVDLDEDDIEELFHASLGRGFSPDATEAVFAARYGDNEALDPSEQAWEDVSYEMALGELAGEVSEEGARIEQRLGRPLTEGEVEAIADGVMRNIERGDELSVDEAAFDEYCESSGRGRLDLDHEADRRQFYTERLAEQNAAHEAREALERAEQAERRAGFDPGDPDDHVRYIAEYGEGEPRIELDLDNERDRHQYLTMRMQDVEVDEVA
jgi:hypothetical protein